MVDVCDTAEHQFFDVLLNFPWDPKCLDLRILHIQLVSYGRHRSPPCLIS